MLVVNEDRGGSLAQRRAFPQGAEMLSQLLPQADQVETSLHFFFPLLFFFLSAPEGLDSPTCDTVHNFNAISLAQGHTCRYKCAREAPLGVDEGGLRYDITRRRKARVSLAEWADVALALMVPTSDGNATTTVVYGALIRSIKHL